MTELPKQQQLDRGINSASFLVPAIDNEELSEELFPLGERFLAHQLLAQLSSCTLPVTTHREGKYAIDGK